MKLSGGLYEQYYVAQLKNHPIHLAVNRSGQCRFIIGLVPAKAIFCKIYASLMIRLMELINDTVLALLSAVGLTWPGMTCTINWYWLYNIKVPKGTKMTYYFRNV